MTLTGLSLQKCIQVEYIFFCHMQGNELDSALPPTCQVCCLWVFALATSCVWNPCAPGTYKMNSLTSSESVPRSTLPMKSTPNHPDSKLQFTLSCPIPWPWLFQNPLYPDLLSFLHNSNNIRTCYTIYIFITYL